MVESLFYLYLVVEPLSLFEKSLAKTFTWGKNNVSKTLYKYHSFVFCIRLPVGTGVPDGPQTSAQNYGKSLCLHETKGSVCRGRRRDDPPQRTRQTRVFSLRSRRRENDMLYRFRWLSTADTRLCQDECRRQNHGIKEDANLPFANLCRLFPPRYASSRACRGILFSPATKEEGYKKPSPAGEGGPRSGG